ncbi:hypothetical protein DUE52_19025 [Larkinella punicea]|uniref:Uncharacterized protein n=1 Tax=Larkinella punicea TaxID=2315727 RepID=A0A368JJY6_9BACT|nr:hypothetical protein DUE52_19025 [Larkinella punicea]
MCRSQRTPNTNTVCFCPRGIFGFCRQIFPYNLPTRRNCWWPLRLLAIRVRSPATG